MIWAGSVWFSSVCCSLVDLVGLVRLLDSFGFVCSVGWLVWFGWLGFVLVGLGCLVCFGQFGCFPLVWFR